MLAETKALNNDPALLDLMLADMHKAPALYRPTNFWGIRERALVDELKSVGLAGFRRRRGSHLVSFGATDFKNPLYRLDLKTLRYVHNRLFRLLPGYTGGLDRLSRYLSGAIVPRAGLSAESAPRLAWAFAEQQGRHAKFARPLADLSESDAGDPEEQFLSEEGGRYTFNFLNYYLMYAYASRFIDFERISTFAELGSGCGRQIEVLFKLHPGVTYIMFDIAPQLYVAESYLTAVFGDKVVSYRETRELASLASLMPGKIYVCGSWQFPLIQTRPIDLFWNAASLQEMEPDVVMNYLKQVNDIADTVFLETVMHGHHVAKRPGAPGVIAKTTRDHYETGLSSMAMLAEERKITCLGDATISTSDAGHIRYPTVSFWKKQDRGAAGMTP